MIEYMSLYDGLVFFFWLLYIGFFSATSVDVKHNKGGGSDWKSNHFALRMTVFFVLLILSIAWRHGLMQWFEFQDLIPDDPLIGAIGTTLCGVGVIFAISARIYIGRNWSAQPTIKEEHELVTTGPYAVMRHPIYAGLLTAVLGSILVGGALWILILLVVALMASYRMHKEEVLMMQEFPIEYAAYKKRTAMIFPYLL